MQKPDKTERKMIRAAGESLDDRQRFAQEIGNFRVNAFRLRQAILRTARQYLQRKGVSEGELNRMAPDMAPPAGWRGTPTTGKVNIFALLIDFTDYTHTNDSTVIKQRLFGSPTTGAPYESLSNYYTRSSYGKLDLSGGDVLGWYRTNKKRADVPQTRAGREALIKEALQHFENQGHNFKPYDNDNDGVIDYFMVFWAGPDGGWGNFWWGYQTEFQDQTFQVDGLKMGAYSWQWECRPVGQPFTPQVVIHETGHALGLPDLYDYDGDVGPDGGVGGLDMMDANLGDHNCFSKWMLEWASPKKIISSGKETISLKSSSESEDFVVIWPGLDDGEFFSEYFVVQNRHRSGNDTVLPADGLLIWHIDATLDSSGNDFLYNNSFADHKMVRLMEADGLEEIEQNLDNADSGDFYTEGKTFGRTTTPASTRYDGSPSYVEISSIIHNGSEISATYELKSTADLVIAGLSAIPNPAQSGKPIRFSVTVKNIGQEAAGPTVGAISLTNIVTGKATVAYLDVPTLLPGKSKTVSLRHSLAGTSLFATRYSVAAAADAKQDMPEKNEFNNRRVITVTVTPKLPPR